MNKEVILIVFLFLCFSCRHEQNTKEFNSIVDNHYNSCIKKDSCFIDLGKKMPFNWSKMFILDDEYSELNSDEVAEYIGVKSYCGYKNGHLNRSLLFISNNEVIYEVLTPYDVESGIDPSPMFIEFINNQKSFDVKNARFKIYKQSSSGYILEWIPNSHIINLSDNKLQQTRD